MHDGVRVQRAATHLFEFVFGAGEADFEAVDLAGPATVVGFGDSGEQVGVDLGEPWQLGGIGAQQRATQAGVFVLAWCGVGAAARAELDFAFLEVGEELVPFVVGDVAIFLDGSQCSAAGDERSVVFDHVTVIDSDVALGGVEVVVAEDLGGDVDG